MHTYASKPINLDVTDHIIYNIIGKFQLKQNLKQWSLPHIEKGVLSVCITHAVTCCLPVYNSHTVLGVCVYLHGGKDSNPCTRISTLHGKLNCRVLFSFKHISCLPLKPFRFGTV